MRRRTEGRLEAIVEAALCVFTRHGYAETQMADIARAAGVSTGTLYLYAESKEALFHATLRHAQGKSLSGEPLPLTFPGWTGAMGELKRFSAGVSAWPRLSAALTARTRPSAATLAAIAGELYDLIAANRRTLTLIDRCARDIADLHNVYESGLRDRYITELERLAARLPHLAQPTITARAFVELIAWMAMHRHGDRRPLPAAEDEIRTATLTAAAATLQH
ncbi:MAG: helix-turn-helix transcriptional regulator [Alphaproteobacteria bacterium]|nr:helix-turn-helix transcriptional regulator [Alphaproteobacteria bacterium]